jgi:hypothetical protein
VITTLFVLDSGGDTRVTWDPADPASVEAARRTVADLKSLGYSFFLADGGAVAGVDDADGLLIVRRLTPDEVLSPPDGPPAAGPEGVPAPKRRGRPPKGEGRKVVAVRPVRGG